MCKFTQNMAIETIEKATASLRKQLLEHPLYEQIQTPESLRIFMQHHVYAVLDFMSLLKALQVKLTCCEYPWYPKGNPEIRYLINEIVLAEETDINFYGKRQSHYEMYLDAMLKAKADTNTIKNFEKQLARGIDVYLIITSSKLPCSVKQFLTHTFDVIYNGEAHEIAAAFTFGRENLIPAMFSSIISKIQTHFPEEDLSLFSYYFDRHIELDEDEHGPMALQMIESLCENDSSKWEEATNVSVKALEKRLELWDGIYKEIEEARC